MYMQREVKSSPPATTMSVKPVGKPTAPKTREKRPGRSFKTSLRGWGEGHGMVWWEGGAGGESGVRRPSVAALARQRGSRGSISPPPPPPRRPAPPRAAPPRRPAHSPRLPPTSRHRLKPTPTKAPAITVSTASRTQPRRALSAPAGGGGRRRNGRGQRGSRGRCTASKPNPSLRAPFGLYCAPAPQDPPHRAPHRRGRPRAARG
jgi:hypothetical protein